MSHAAMTWAVKQKCGSAAAKFVLMMLADHANGHTGRCNPRQKLLADECEMSLNGLRGQLRKLEELGLITTVHVASDGMKMPNQYDLNMHNSQSAPLPHEMGDPPPPVGGPLPHQMGISNPEVKPGIKPQDTLQVASDSDNASADEDKVIGTLPCIRGADYEVRRSLYDKLEATYPCANVLDELRKMKFWLEDTPNRKPSKQGMTRFIGSWMCKAHDAGRRK